jgi:hypothetical protein
MYKLVFTLAFFIYCGLSIPTLSFASDANQKEQYPSGYGFSYPFLTSRDPDMPAVIIFEPTPGYLLPHIHPQEPYGYQDPAQAQQVSMPPIPSCMKQQVSMPPIPSCMIQQASMPPIPSCMKKHFQLLQGSVQPTNLMSEPLFLSPPARILAPEQATVATNTPAELAASYATTNLRSLFDFTSPISPPDCILANHSNLLDAPVATTVPLQPKSQSDVGKLRSVTSAKEFVPRNKPQAAPKMSTPWLDKAKTPAVRILTRPGAALPKKVESLATQTPKVEVKSDTEPTPNKKKKKAEKAQSAVTTAQTKPATKATEAQSTESNPKGLWLQAATRGKDKPLTKVVPAQETPRHTTIPVKKTSFATHDTQLMQVILGKENLTREDIDRYYRILEGVANPSLEDILDWAKGIYPIFSSARANHLCDGEILTRYVSILGKKAVKQPELRLGLRQHMTGDNNIIRYWCFKVQKLMREGQLSAESLSHILVAYARLDLNMNQAFQNLFNSSITNKLLNNEFESWSLANLIWYSANLKIDLPADYLDAWYSCAFRQIQDGLLDQECLTKIYYGFSIMGLKIPEPLHFHVNASIYNFLKSHSYSIDYLGMILYGSILNGEPLSQELREQVEFSLKESKDNKLLAHAYIALQYFNMLDDLPEASQMLESVPHHCWAKYPSKQTELKSSVASALNALGFKIKKNVWHDPILSPLDFMIPELQLIIMVHGPEDYMSDGQTFKPPYLVEHKALNKSNPGKVLHVPHFEWSKLNGLDEQKTYLKKKINEAK